MDEPNLSAVQFRQKVKNWVFKNPASFSFGEKYIKNHPADFILYRQSAGQLPTPVLKLCKILPSTQVRQIETARADMVQEHQDIQPTVTKEEVEQNINVPGLQPIPLLIEHSNSQTLPIAGTDSQPRVEVIDTAGKIDTESEIQLERSVLESQLLGSVSESIDMQLLAPSNNEPDLQKMEDIGLRENVSISLGLKTNKEEVFQPVQSQEICFAKEQETATLSMTVSKEPLQTVIEENVELSQAVTPDKTKSEFMAHTSSKCQSHDIEDIEQGENKSRYPYQELKDEVRLILTLVRKSTDRWADKNRKRKWEQYLRDETLTNKKVFTYPEAGIEIRDIPIKGLSVFTTKTFLKNEIVIVYSGEGFILDEGYKEEERYGEACNEKDRGAFMFKLQYNSKMVWIDACNPKYGIARLINHGCTSNLRGGFITVNKAPRFYFKAARNIEIGEELVYDYGDKR